MQLMYEQDFKCITAEENSFLFISPVMINKKLVFFLTNLAVSDIVYT